MKSRFSTCISFYDLRPVSTMRIEFEIEYIRRERTRAVLSISLADSKLSHLSITVILPPLRPLGVLQREELERGSGLAVHLSYSDATRDGECVCMYAARTDTSV